MSPRQPHGGYDDQRKLPNNAMQPVGSGTDVWLQMQILELIGSEAGQALIDEARTHGTQRYRWLCAQMIERGHEGLAKDYTARKKADEAARRLRDKKHMLAGWQEQLTRATDAQYREFLIKQIRKTQKYIDEREKYESN